MDVQQNKKGLGQQLNLAFLLGAIFMSIASAALISYTTYERERTTYFKFGAAALTSLHSQISLPFSGSLDHLLIDAFKSYSAFKGVQKLIAFDKKYKELFSIKKDQDYRVIGGWQDLEMGDVRFERETNDALYFTASLNSDSAAYLMLILNKPSLDTYINDFFINAAIVFFLAMFFLTVLSVFIKRLTKSLDEFTSVMTQAASGKKGVRANKETSGELVHMFESFNQMMDMNEKKCVLLGVSRDQARQEANLKSDFAANVSHEIRTPLNGMLGMISLLKGPGLPQKQQDYLEAASASGESLLQVINNVLDFSKIEAGEFDLDLKDLDLRLLLEQVGLLYAEKAQEKRLELCLDLPAKDILFVRGDPVRLRQIISNLLSNAIKFTSVGHITLSARIVSRSEDSGQVDITVTDTGKGIPNDSLDAIFKPFDQASVETATEYGGTGLGLTIVRQLTTLMKGTVSVASVVGEGSCFQLTIPLQMHSLVIDRPAGEARLFSNKNILLVEPFEETRTYIEGMLNAWGIKYQTTASFDEALLKKDSEPDYNPEVCLFNADYSKSSESEFFEKFTKTKLVPMVRLGHGPSVIDKGKGGFSASIDRPVRYEKLRMLLLGVLAGHKSPIQPIEKQKPVPSAILQKLNILVAEDDKSNQLVVVGVLKELGILAEVAENGKEALSMFKSYEYDLILMDCNMPIMDGYESTKAIRSLGVGVKQPIIIALTAKDTKAEWDACRQSGMNACLSKPFQLSKLLTVLEKELESVIKNEDVDETSLMGLVDSAIVESTFKKLAVNTGEGIHQIVHSYLLDTPIYIITLIAAMEAVDRVKILNLAHKIKGGSRNLGAETLVSICVEIEKTCTKKIVDVSKVEQLSTHLEAEFSRVNTELATKLDELNVENDKLKGAAQKTVLVVDDDSSMRMTVASALESEGYQVELAENGRDAIRLFGILHPNIIVMDAIMPIKNGFKACREIKSMAGGDDVSILITTVLESEESLDLAFESGASDFVPKQADLSVLKQRVKRLLSKQSEGNHVQRLAYKDSLTGLPNRAAFVEHVQKELDTAKRNNTKIAIFFIDVDHFKKINDNLGPDAGDALLKALSGRLMSCISPNDMLARIGGDAFVVVLSKLVDVSTQDTIAKTMLAMLKAPFNLSGNEVSASVSIGVAVYPDDGLSKDELLKNSDTAMYRAKAAGRNTYRLYAPEMREVLEQRMRLESELREVVKNEELRLHFQPKKDAKTGKVIGSEALVRWHHHTRGIVPPVEFIPVAEEVGLINEIGFWVLDTACATAKNWQLEYSYYGSVAVNISAVQMKEDDFVFLVETCLNKYELEAKYLELEITESMAFDKTGVMLDKLNQIRDMGVNVAIDDFGTGDLSFSDIKNLPVNTLKLDMEFIENIVENESDMTVVDGMIVLAHNLGMTVVAEGVESQEQYDLLVAHKCDIVQGYFIGKPLPGKIFIKAHGPSLLGLG